MAWIPGWLSDLFRWLLTLGQTLRGDPMRRIEKLEHEVSVQRERLEHALGLHEGGWVQLMIDRRIVWMTARAYDRCYVGLDDRAKARVDQAMLRTTESRFDLADLERLSR